MINTEIKVGIFVVLGAFFLFYMTANIEKMSFGTQKGYSLYVLLDTAQGLVKNSHVKISGVPIGRIKKIDLKGDMARVEIVLPNKVRIRNNSVAYIKMESLLGEKFLDIESESPDAPLLEPGGEIRQGGAPPDLDRLIAQLNAVAGDMKKIMEALSSVFGGKAGEKNIKEIVLNVKSASSSLNNIMKENKNSIGNIVTNMDKFVGGLPAISKDVKRTVSNIKGVSEKVSRGEGTLGKLINEDDIYLAARNTIGNVNNITQKIYNGEGTLGKLLNDDDIYKNTKDSIDNIKTVSSRLANGEGTLGKLLVNSKIYDDSLETVEGINRIVKKIERGEGTLGKLVNDEALYIEASKALRGISRSTEGIAEQVPITTLGVVIGTIIK